MRKIILLFIFLFAGYQAYAQTEFITTWKTDNPGTSNATSITIPTTGSGYNYDVSWNNDGVWESGFTGAADHDYGTAGTYTVAIRGSFPRIYFNNSGDRQKILSIEQWGTNVWRTMGRAFYGCSNLVLNATDAPNLSLVTDMGLMFTNASKTNGDLSNWDVSKVTNMTSLFYGATAFNGKLSNWDVSNVTTMYAMFYAATVFNQDIGNWNVGNVTNMHAMFRNASAFNQNIGNWDVSKVANMQHMFLQASVFNQDIGNWDVSKVTTMEFMFSSASTFNQNIGNWDVGKVATMEAMFSSASNFNQDIGNWDVANVRNMSRMFWFAIRFNQDIGAWDVSNVNQMDLMFRRALAFDQDIGTWNVSNVTNMSDMFMDTAISPFNYDALLNGWNNLTLQNGVRFSGGNSKYCEGEAARTNMIDTFGWTISDGGSAGTGCELSIADAELNTIRLYPNPAKHSIVIENQSSTQIQELAVYDLIGRLVKTIDLQNMAQRTSIDVSSLDKATYFINITTDQGRIVKKLIKN